MMCKRVSGGVGVEWGVRTSSDIIDVVEPNYGTRLVSSLV